METENLDRVRGRRETAARLNVCERTLVRLEKAGAIKRTQVGERKVGYTSKFLPVPMMDANRLRSNRYGRGAHGWKRSLWVIPMCCATWKTTFTNAHGNQGTTRT